MATSDILFTLKQDGKRIVPDELHTVTKYTEDGDINWSVVTYKRQNGTYKNPKGIQNALKYTDDKTPVVLQNVPVTGIKLGKTIGGGSGPGASAQIELIDPRGLQFALPFGFVVSLITTVGYTPETGFNKPLVYTWYDDQLSLCPATLDELNSYKKALESETEYMLAKLVPGKYYRHKHYTGYYLGVYWNHELEPITEKKAVGYNFRYNSSDDDRLVHYDIEMGKRHLFLMDGGKFNYTGSTPFKFIEDTSHAALTPEEIDENYRKFTRLPAELPITTDMSTSKATEFLVTKVNVKADNYVKFGRYTFLSPNKKILVYVRIGNLAERNSLMSIMEILDDGTIVKTDVDLNSDCTQEQLESMFPGFTSFGKSEVEIVVLDSFKMKNYFSEFKYFI